MKSLPNCDPVHKISIVSRGMALGWTMSLPEEDRYLISRSQLVDQIAGTMGGRAAEAIIFGDITSGASDDIQRVTDTARRMVTQWGMSEKLGTVAMGVKQEMVFLGRDLGEQRNYSEEIAALIDEEVRGLVSDGYETAKRILTERRGHLELISEHLKNVETIDAAEFDALLAQSPAPAAASRSTAS
jgi:cell division protease FtsH